MNDDDMQPGINRHNSSIYPLDDLPTGQSLQLRASSALLGRLARLWSQPDLRLMTPPCPVHSAHGSMIADRGATVRNALKRLAVIAELILK
jgi:hypothetical protein